MIQYLYLGRVDYDQALRLQKELVTARFEGRVENVLLLLEHPPVLTLGRNANRSNILASGELLARRGVTVHEIDRGGDVTYHGPGQLVGYPIFDLRTLRNPNGGRMGPVDFVRLMEEALIRLCAGFGVLAGRIQGLTGVWCPAGGGPLEEGCGSGAARKIAAIGIHVARGITSHGFAFNVTTDLKDFELIVPCGIPDHAVTSLKNEFPAREVERPEALPGMEEVAHAAARQFGLAFDQQVLAAESLAALESQVSDARPPSTGSGQAFDEPRAGSGAPAQVKAAEDAGPKFPAEDTPLRAPAEVERLRRGAGRPEEPQFRA
jgi:lipoyl(octanoyl) transferase